MDKKTSAKPKTVSRGPWNYFHDCHICRGMKSGRGQTAEDLKKLFEEAESENSDGGQKQVKD